MIYPSTYADYLADTARNLTVRDGGGTFDARTGKSANLTSGYIVGGAVESVTVASADVEAFRDTFANFRSMANTVPGRYVGTWLTGTTGTDYGSVVVFDVCTVESALEPALWLARFRGEEAIYDVATRNVIYV